MNKAARKSLQFTNIHLENWKNFTLVDVPLQSRVFLLGPNASGKSNFLDTLRFLKDIVAVGGGFEYAVRKRGGVSPLRSLAARHHPDIMIHVHVGGRDSASEWEYGLQFSQDNNQNPILKKEWVKHSGVSLLERPNADDVRDEMRLRQTHLEQINSNQEFRELADFFKSTRYLHLVPQLIREPERSLVKSEDPFGSDFLEQIAKTPQKTRDSRLRRIQEALKLAVPQLDSLEIKREDRGTPHLRSKYRHWRSQGAWQTEEQFSDGTLRLIGLLWAILDRNGPLLLEEPELSLHSEVVRYIPQMFRKMQRRTGRQVFISTHSAELISDEGVGLDEVFILTPTDRGVEVASTQNKEQLKALVAGGMPLAQALQPYTRPKNLEQLAFFGD